MIGAISAALGAGSSLFQLITGAQQKRQANKLQDQLAALQQARPEYSTPQEVLTSLAISRQAYADPNMPGQQAQLDRAGLAANNTAAAAGAGGDPFAAAVASQGNLNRTNENIGAQSAQYSDSMRQQYQGQLQNKAQYTDMEFQMNKFAPWSDNYQDTLNRQRDLYQAGNQNIYGGIDGIGRIGIAALNSGLGKTTQTGISGQSSMDIYNRYNQTASGQSFGSNPQQMALMMQTIGRMKGG